MMERLLIAAALLATPLAHAADAKTQVKRAPWGKTAEGTPVDLYTLTDGTLNVTITNFGAHIVSIQAPDRNGKMTDVILGFKDIAGFEADTKTYMGSVVGRYGNRIAKGTFTLDGATFHIPLNNGVNTLHGGTTGFDRKVWTGTRVHNGVSLTLMSPDGDMGFPGLLIAHVRYTLVGGSLHIEYSAQTNKPTVVNLTNHSYFNLAGESSGTILGQVLTLSADRYTPVDAGLIPTGQLAPVDGTPFDFRKATAIGERIGATNEQLKIAGGYDHNWVLNGTGMKQAAHVLDPASGRTLTVTTTEPGVQFYSGNFLDGTLTGVGGVPYVQHAGFCLETQHFPDSPNEPTFPSTTLKPGEVLHSTTVFTFGVDR